MSTSSTKDPFAQYVVAPKEDPFAQYVAAPPKEDPFAQYVVDEQPTEEDGAALVATCGVACSQRECTRPDCRPVL